MNEQLDIAELSLVLLVPATKDTPSDKARIEICGEQWILEEFANFSDAPPFTCISYTWGIGRTNNPFESQYSISDRTLSVLETAIKVSKSTKCWKEALPDRNGNPDQLAVETAIGASRAFWIDVYCVPHEKLSREKCLRNMGAIYSAAHHVLAVLSTRCIETFKKIRHAKNGATKPQLQLLDLLSVNEDEWITRAWTYQEIAVCDQIFFVAEYYSTVLLSRIEFLDELVDATTDYADAKGWERSKLASEFPNLDSLQEVAAELQIVEHTGRPAFQIMSAMHQRKAEREDDRVYAMLGVLTTLAPKIENYSTLLPSEIFMRLCEEKVDFSYIYSIEPRSLEPGKSWRPIPGRLTPVISGMLCYGEGLSGAISESHLEMHNMCCMKVGEVNYVLAALSAYIGTSFPGKILALLKLKGFTGCGEYLNLNCGYFFPQNSHGSSKDCIVAISNDAVFAQGAPALLLRPKDVNMYEFVDVGVFIGRSPTSKETIRVS